MDYKNFINLVTKINNKDLTGHKSHEKMIPKDRIKDLKQLEVSIEKAKKAAVLALFVPKKNIPHLVLIKRNSYHGVHSAQIAFPGGKPEVEDKDLQATALREAWEEIGVNIQEVKIVTHLSKVYIQPSNFLVTPFLGYCEIEPRFILDKKEVTQLITVNVLDLLSSDNLITHQVKTSYSNNKIEVPAFLFEQEVVWGATAMMIAEIIEIIKNYKNTKFS
jgi:8-oxo-dGTP pyrophosphatase MutT (NUDIX family)